MNRNHIRYLVAFLILCVMVGAAHAGGWAVITLDDLPDHAVAGKPIKLVFVVRQHGRTLLTGLQPRVRAISATGLVANSAVFPAIDSYSAIFPRISSSSFRISSVESRVRRYSCNSRIASAWRGESFPSAPPTFA